MALRHRLRHRPQGGVAGDGTGGGHAVCQRLDDALRGDGVAGRSGVADGQPAVAMQLVEAVGRRGETLHAARQRQRAAGQRGRVGRGRQPCQPVPGMLQAPRLDRGRIAVERQQQGGVGQMGAIPPAMFDGFQVRQAGSDSIGRGEAHGQADQRQRFHLAAAPLARKDGARTAGIDHQVGMDGGRARVRRIAQPQFQVKAAALRRDRRGQAGAQQHFRPAQARLPRQEAIETGTLQVPAVAQRMQQRVVVAALVAAPPGTAAMARRVRLGEEILRDAQRLEQTVGFRRNALADAKRRVVARLDHEHVLHAMLGQRQRAGAAGRAAADDDDPVALPRWPCRAGTIRYRRHQGFGFGRYTLSMAVLRQYSTRLLSSLSNRLSTSR
ncbi:MAG TPA: hypothetical protein VFT25_19830 [Janthinobacterium sp.]|nr:hypothetical protein [Janthinobacterium sp.]HEU4818333.1 hypothetical protein [Janthinobacterium sp.]